MVHPFPLVRHLIIPHVKNVYFCYLRYHWRLPRYNEMSPDLVISSSLAKSPSITIRPE